MWFKKSWHGKLKPNCLMTVRPLVFVFETTGWMKNKHHHRMASMLAQHGYEVYQVQLPQSNLESQQRSLKSIVPQLNHSHVFFEPAIALALHRLVATLQLQCSSLIQISENLQEANESWYLEKAESLAEMDFLAEDRSKTLAPHP